MQDKPIHYAYKIPWYDPLKVYTQPPNPINLTRAKGCKKPFYITEKHFYLIYKSGEL
jgi:hypothetical protein